MISNEIGLDYHYIPHEKLILVRINADTLSNPIL
jgi:hypothetical protein